MTEHWPPTLLPFLQAAAYLVVIAWGVGAARHLISILLLSLLLAYCILPLPQWLMHRFKLRKGAAIGSAATIIALGYLVCPLTWSRLRIA